MPGKIGLKINKCQEMGVITYPKLEKGIIHKYRKFKYENRYYVKCDEKLRNENGVLCSCTMELEREDNFKKWLLYHQHVCKPGKPITLNTIYSYAHELNQDYNSITEDSLHKQMALFTGLKNLPLDLLTSDEFYNLAIDFITYGLTIAGSKDAR